MTMHSGRHSFMHSGLTFPQNAIFLSSLIPCLENKRDRGEEVLYETGGWDHNGRP
jgi:hypothetical protein